MQHVPTPDILNPQVPQQADADNTTQLGLRLAAYESSYQEISDYAKRLWDTLDATRAYLWRSLPSDPHAPGPQPRTCAAPTGPDDTDGWNDWMQTYAGVAATLWGPQGDSGFGAREAHDTARTRRTAPNVRVAARYGIGTPGGASQENKSPATTATHATSHEAARRHTLRTVTFLIAAAAVGRRLTPRRSTHT